MPLNTTKQVEYPIILQLKDALIVSCQASDGEPLCAPEHIKALSLCAITGGAKGLRLEGTENIQAVRDITKLPIIGLAKTKGLSEKERLKQVYITATFAEASELATAGADIIALDATDRPRPDGNTASELIAQIHKELKLPVMADISTENEALAAAAAGADLISTTLFGYTNETFVPADHGPALDLLKKVCGVVQAPVILEGRIWHPEEVTQAFKLGAYAVVVGSAITRPHLITARFVKAILNN